MHWRLPYTCNCHPPSQNRHTRNLYILPLSVRDHALRHSTQHQPLVVRNCITLHMQCTRSLMPQVIRKQQTHTCKYTITVCELHQAARAQPGRTWRWRFRIWRAVYTHRVSNTREQMFVFGDLVFHCAPSATLPWRALMLFICTSHTVYAFVRPFAAISAALRCLSVAAFDHITFRGKVEVHHHHHTLLHPLAPTISARICMQARRTLFECCRARALWFLLLLLVVVDVLQVAALRRTRRKDDDKK